MNILITGCCGFIGFHISKLLLENGHSVIGIDNLNDYYDIKLKKDRVEELYTFDNFICYIDDISDLDDLSGIFETNKIDKVLHLAAQAGVRYSIENPTAYFKSNIEGFFNILECCKINKLPLIYASSSSVYGDVNEVPYKETDNTDYPISFYGATKKIDEIMAYSYFKSFGVNSIGLRFFTVYGPFGRPDMAYFSFTEKILNNKEIELFNNGENSRDFTYIDDIVQSIFLLLSRKQKKECKIFNIGNSDPIKTTDFVSILSKVLNKKPNIKLIDRQSGDVLHTYSNCEKLENEILFKPKTKLQDGLAKFVEWYKNYYSV